MSTNTSNSLLDRLMKADTESEVVAILTEAGFWQDPSVWRFYGDQSENWATVGNQQSRAEQALIEKATNSIDTKLIAAARIAGIPIRGSEAPQSLFKARDLLFSEKLKDIEGLSNSITVAATGSRRRPSITIVDDGEGQTPSDMPETILSLHRGNKNSIPFVQGKFNMGGSGVLEFCGTNHNVELVLSKRNPALLSPNSDEADQQWSFTVIRREDPGPASPRASRFTYLAPGPADSKGNRALLSFSAPTLPIFPHKNQPYVRQAEWGTLFKLYEYGIRATSSMMLKGGLMGRVRILLPEPALPIRFHECRDYIGDPNGSFDTPMAGLIYTLEEDRKNPKRQNVEWFDKFDIDIEGEKFSGRIYLFRKRGRDENKNPADNYRKDEGIVFTYNGQCQAFFSKDFFRRKAVRQDYLWDSLLVFIDCSGISVRAHERLFMPNRENLRHGDLKFRLEQEIEEKLRQHDELKQIANDRRKNELSDNPEVSETFEKFVEEMVRKHPLLEKILGPGFRIANPFKPQSVEAQEKVWEGRRFPTKFHFRQLEADKTLTREANINSQVRIVFTTDAENDYFRRDDEPGEFSLFQVMDDKLEPAKNWPTPNLFEGSVNLSLSLPPDVAIGDILTFEAQVMDPSRLEPFRNRFTLSVKEERDAVPPRLPQQPGPKPDRPAEQSGKDNQGDARLAVPNPIEVWEIQWPDRDPAFDKFTAMRIKRPPDAEEGSSIFDYYINMNNVFIDQAIKERPKRVREIRNRYKFGMTLLTLALIRHDLEVRKREQPTDEDEKTQRQDIHETVAEVTTAIAPFLLPLVDSLSQITGDYEHLSAIAGEAA
jgi:hypothetical protein